MSWHDDCTDIDELPAGQQIDALTDTERARLLLDLCSRDEGLAALPFRLAILRARARLGEVVA